MANGVSGEIIVQAVEQLLAVPQLKRETNGQFRESAGGFIPNILEGLSLDAKTSERITPDVYYIALKVRGVLSIPQGIKLAFQREQLDAIVEQMKGAN